MSQKTDFKDKIKKRMQILFSRKKCKSCFAGYDQNFISKNIFKSINFSKDRSENIFLYGADVPLIASHKYATNIPISFKILKQNRYEKRTSIRLLFMCECGYIDEINIPNNYFG